MIRQHGRKNGPRSNNHFFARQEGMVSIMVTMILMIVLSLIVLGFAQISRRNQRVTLDRQLSTQAFYAAESGVNDAIHAMKSNNTAAAKTSCAPASSGIYAGINNILDPSSDISYSCLLVNPNPPDLQYNGVGSQGVVIPIISASGAPISSIDINWKSDITNPLSGCQASYGSKSLLPSTATGWLCGFGILRFDLVDASGNQTANNYQAKTMTTFAVPLTSGATNQITFGPNTNAIAKVLCTATSCDLTVKGLNSNTYFMRASTIYQAASVLTVSPHDASGNAIQTANAQALIDSTGKAKDVLRRIQVRVPYTNTSGPDQLPMSAISSSDSVCKRFSIMQGWVGNSPGGVSGANPLCN